MFKKTLVAVDGSELAERALDPTLTMAKQVNVDRPLLLVCLRRNV